MSSRVRSDGVAIPTGFLPAGRQDFVSTFLAMTLLNKFHLCYTCYYIIDAMLKLIIFDWDDVITTGAKNGYYACYQKALEADGISLDPNEFDARLKRKWGQPYREEIKELLKEYPHLVEKACDTYQKHKFGNTFIDSLRPIPGVNTLFTQLKKTYILAVATANQPKMLSKIITKFNIPDVFSQIVTAYDPEIPPHKTKPDPLMLQIILQNHNIQPDEAIYVGDASNDVQMAKNAGVAPVVVLTGHLSQQEAKELGVEWILPDVTHLPEIFDSVCL